MENKNGRKKLTTLTPKTKEICKECKNNCKNTEGSTLIWCINFKDEK